MEAMAKNMPQHFLNFVDKTDRAMGSKRSYLCVQVAML